MTYGWAVGKNVPFLIIEAVSGRSRLAGFSTSAPTVPIHPHLRDQLFRRLTEDGTPSLHPFSGPAPAKNALELGREPGTSSKDLSRGEGDLELMVGHI